MRCAHIYVFGTRTDQPETCDDEVVDGEEFCELHLNAENPTEPDPDEAYERLRDDLAFLDDLVGAS